MRLQIFFRNYSLLLAILFISVSEPFFAQKQQTKTYIIEIKKMKFIPQELILNKGDTVIWINKDFFSHDVTELKNKEWSSSEMEKGASWKKVITKSADYYCSLHVVMKGSLLVK